MVEIDIQDERIVVSGDEIQEWEFNLFLTISLGFDENYQNNSFIFPFSGNGYDVVAELISYLENKSISYKATTVINEIINEIKSDEIEFQRALKSNSVFKNLKPPKEFSRTLKEYQVKGFSHLINV